MAFFGALRAVFVGAFFATTFLVAAFLAVPAFLAFLATAVVGLDFVFGASFFAAFLAVFLAVFLEALATTRRVVRFGAAFERFTAFFFNDFRVTDRFCAFFVAMGLSFTFRTGEFDLWGLPDG